MKPEDTCDSWKHDSRDWSRFMQKACEESLDALENHDHVKGLWPQSGGSWSGWDTMGVPAPGAPGSSDDDAKGKGKGKYLQQGPLRGLVRGVRM